MSCQTGVSEQAWLYKASEIDIKKIYFPFFITLAKKYLIFLFYLQAIDEPSFSVAYALMCKELAQMQVSGTEPGDSSATNFRKSIITRCQMEFENDSKNEKLRLTKAKEIEECTDPEKKKELQLLYEEEERRIRMKSVGNIRFIGELFKQGMLTKKIMHFCINHLLQHRDEENLECLCKLLTTIGKNLEINDVSFSKFCSTGIWTCKHCTFI